MKLASRSRAEEAFSRLPLTVANQRLASYWLSLWREDALPRRSDFSPAQMKSLLPGMGIFEVWPGVQSRCRLAGTAIQHALGREIGGSDWRAYTPEDQWGARLERNGMIAEGSVGIGVRPSMTPDGMVTTQELQLPFADRTESGARLILFHLDWRPPGSSFKQDGARKIRIANQFHAVSLYTP